MTLVQKVMEAGVIGAGGAGFPTHVKLAGEVDTVIVNGAECEPLLYGDQSIMENRAGDIVAGLRRVTHSISEKRGAQVRSVIGVKGKYKAAITAFKSAIKPNENIEILELPNVYPAGDEQFLLFEATGRIVPEGGIPLMIGAMVMNVGTLAQVNEALNGRPVTSRLVTLGGAVEKPLIADIPIGTPFSEIVPKLGPKMDDYVFLINGPMMGRIGTDPAEVTTKTMGGLFILPKDHSHVRRLSRKLTTEIRLGKSACEVCRYCTDYCPRYLQGHAIEPHKIMRVINYDRDLDTKTITSAWLCCECGVCDLFACPMALSPRVFFREFKRKLKDAGIKNPHNRSELEPDQMRSMRGTPVSRLVTRLGLSEYDIRPELDPNPWSVSKVVIKLDTHIGAPAKPVVVIGAKVARGDLIGKIPEGSMGAIYHASITGTVTSVLEKSVTIERNGR